MDYKIDYKKIGLKVGIEIHQQLDTCKLFCECPSLLRNDKPDIVIKRKLHAVVGETGEKDTAAQYEESRQKIFVYEAYSDSTCLVELDEEPPHTMNKEALKIAMQIAMLLGAKPVDEIQVMRKTVIDGSNTSGFQRTALIAKGGAIDSVRIPFINLEEDAGRRISEDESSVTFRLDRLGIPEVEIATDASITSPEQATDVAKKIGMILRSCHVKRGIGTIRQDVNISIKHGARVELKHVQDLRAMSKIIENEILRQINLLEISDELKRRGIKKIPRDFVVLSSKLEHTRSNLLKKAMNNGIVLGVRLPGFGGLVGKEIQPNRRLGSEFADHAKTAGVSGIIHSDELPAYGITEEEKQRIAKALNCEEKDAFVMVVAQPEIAKKALERVILRAEQAIKGVPREVRATDGTNTRFLRPMPGAARLYPETDIPPIKITKEFLDGVRQSLPKTLLEREKELSEVMPAELARQIVHSRNYDLFEEIINEIKIDPKLVATTLTSILKDLKRKGVKIKMTNNDYKQLFRFVAKGKVSKEAIPKIIEKAKPGEIQDVIKEFEILPDGEIRKIISNIVKMSPEKSKKELMGIIMSRINGRADGKKVMKLLDTELKRMKRQR